MNCAFILPCFVFNNHNKAIQSLKIKGRTLGVSRPYKGVQSYNRGPLKEHRENTVPVIPGADVAILKAGNFLWKVWTGCKEVAQSCSCLRESWGLKWHAPKQARLKINKYNQLYSLQLLLPDCVHIRVQCWMQQPGKLSPLHGIHISMANDSPQSCELSLLTVLCESSIADYSDALLCDSVCGKEH